MGSSLNEKLNRLPEVRREQILAEADRLQAKYLTLQMLRKANKFTQATIARMQKKE